jgi:GTP-binding protein LepA
VVFCGLFPVDAADFEDLRAAIGKLRLNDASFSYEMETSGARLRLPLRLPGPLHLEIIQERLEREFNLDLIATAPSVVYKIRLRDGRRSSCTTRPTCRTSCRSRRSPSPGSRPRSDPDEYLGGVIKLCQDRRGIQASCPMSAAAPWSSTTCR